MKLHAEMLARHSGELIHAQGRIPCRCVAQEGDNFGCELVRTARSRPLGKQARKAILIERPDRLVAGGTREPEADRAMRNGQLLGAHGAHHFVFDLQHVPRIEELFLGEAPVAHTLGVPVQASMTPQGSCLSILAHAVGSSVRNAIYSPDI